jgi:membrane protein DedA with SNARE-associated domain
MWLTFAWVLADQIGLPLPAAPALLGAGALARAGRVDLGRTIALAVLASILGHTAWYEAGRRGGRRVLAWLCRISLEPDACVRRGENLLGRNVARTLIVAHFVPGLDLVLQPLAALAGLSRARYLAVTALGALVWAAGLVGLGFLLGTPLLALVHRVGATLGLVLALGLLAYLAWKVGMRYRLRAHLRTARLQPEELLRLLEQGKAFVIDLRHPSDLAADPRRIVGAVPIAAEALAEKLDQIPRDRQIVLYCT